MATKITVRRGLFANLPTLDVGEFGFTTDTNQLYIGGAGGNVSILTQGGYGPELLPEPVDFENIAWGKTRASVSDAGSQAPTGDQAYIIHEDTTPADTHYISDSITQTIDNVYEQSILVKANNRTWILVSQATDGTRSAFFNMSTGTTGTIGASLLAYGIEDQGNDWYRCWIRYTPASTGSKSIIFYIAEADNDATFNGLDQDSLYIASASVKEYIPSSMYINKLKVAGGNNLLITNANETDFGLLQFGGTTSSYPALKRNSDNLEVRLADDSALTTLLADGVQVAGNVVVGAGQYFTFETRSRISAPSDGNIRLSNNAGTDFGLLQFGGTTSAYPALARKTGTPHLVARLANDTGNCEMYATSFYAQSNSFLGWAGSTKLSTPSDGNIRLTNAAGDDFGLLQFGGTTSAYPALTRTGADLQARTADNLDLTSFHCKNFVGNGYIKAGTLNSIYWNSRARIFSPADSVIKLTNNLDTDFSLLQFGGTTVAFPALKRAGTSLEVKVADDSSYSTLRSGVVQVTGGGSEFNFAGKSRIQSPADGYVTLLNSAGTDWTLLQLGGVTSSYPAIKRSGDALHARLADDSDYCQILCVGLTGTSFVTTTSGGYFRWGTRSRMYSDAAGNIRLTDDTATDFGLLQFGGTTSSYPAIGRALGQLTIRLADNSAYGPLILSSLFAQANVQAGASGKFWWDGRSQITSPADGDILLTDSTGTTSGLLQFGGTTSAFPALKRSGQSLLVRLADDSGYSNINAASFTAESKFLWSGGRSVIESPVDGWLKFTNAAGTDFTGIRVGGSDLTLADSAGTDFGLLRFGGSTNAYPALKRSGTTLETRLADDSNYTDFFANGIRAFGIMRVQTTLRWGTTGSILDGRVDGNLLVTDVLGADFGLLQFGGTTNAYPALQRNSTTISVRLADDSDRGNFIAGEIFGEILQAETTGSFRWSGRCRIHSDADGNIRLADNAAADFGLLQFGGTTNAYPALKRSGVSLWARKADDTGSTNFYAGAFIADFVTFSFTAPSTGEFLWSSRSRIKSPADGNVLLQDNGLLDFGLLQFGGTTNGYPAWKRAGGSLEARLADDSGRTSVFVQGLTAFANITAGAAQPINWTSRSQIFSDTDGTIRLTNNAGTDFTRLVFGDTTSSFPSLERSGVTLIVRRADALANAPLRASLLSVDGGNYFNFDARSRLYSDADGSIRLTDSTGLDWPGLLILGQATSSYPALGQVGGRLVVKKGDDLTWAAAEADRWYARSRVVIGSSAGTYVQLRTQVGNHLTLLDDTETDFSGLLQFGGTTNAYPALKRVGNSLSVTLADNSSNASLSFHSSTAINTGYRAWNGRSRLYSDADGDIRLTDSAGTDFGLLQVGGVTNAYPALKRSGSTIHFRLADDSNWTDITFRTAYASDSIRAGESGFIGWANRSRMRSPSDGTIRISNNAETESIDLDVVTSPSGLTITGTVISTSNLYSNAASGIVRAGQDGFFFWTNRSQVYSDSDGNIRLTDSLGSDFGLLQFGGTTAAYPALKRSGTNLSIRLADDSTYASISVASITSYGDIQASGSGYLGYQSRSRILSDVDGNIRLSNNLESDFGLLQFGGTSAGFPALKKSGAQLQVRLADDSGYSTLACKSVTCTEYLTLQENASTPPDSPNLGKLYVRQSDNALIYRKDTGTEYDLTQTAGVSGGGTTNKIPVWTGASDLGDSGLYWDNANTLLQFGGTSSSFPALKQVGTSLVCQLADDSTYAGFAAASISSAAYVRAASGSYFEWSARSRIYSDADGNIRLTDNAGTDFDLLQFGGTSNLFPAIKRFGSGFRFRTADDLAWSNIEVGTVNGNGGIRSAASSSIYFNGRSRFYSDADGDIRLTDTAGTDFGLLQLGGTTSAYPAIQRTGSALSLRKADDSSYTDTYARTYFSATATGGFGWSSQTVLRCPADGDMRISNNADTDFGMLQFGGTSASYPALKRSSSNIEVKKADDSAYTTLVSGALVSLSSVEVASASNYQFKNRSLIWSSADGNLLLTDNAGTDFGLLQFGGTDASYPALKRAATTINCRLADDSGYCGIRANQFYGTSTAWFSWESRAFVASPAYGSIELRDIADAYNASLTAGELLVEGPPLTVSDTDQYGAFIRRTLNDPTSEALTQEFRLIKADLSITDDTGWDNVYLMDLQVDGVSKCSLDSAGNLAPVDLHAQQDVRVGTTSAFYWLGRSQITSPVDGNIRLTNGAGTDFGLLQFGGTTTSFPALKRSGTGLQCRLADDSAYSSFTAATLVANGYHSWPAKSRMYSDADGNIRLTDNAATDFGLLQFGGTTSGYPALKRNAGILEVRNADDSGYTSMNVGNLSASGSIISSSSGYLGWTLRSRMYADADGEIRLTDTAGTDFGLLQFGGATSAYPALKRNGTAIETRLADDSQRADIFVNKLYANDDIISAANAPIRWSSRSSITSPVDGDIRLTDSTGTDFGLLQFGGTTSSFPALKRNGTGLQARLADDSNYAVFECASLVANVGDISLPNAGRFNWGNRTRIYSDADGNVRLTDNALTSFGLLQFGGTSNAYPALKRSGAELEARLADDSSRASFSAFALKSSTIVQAANNSVFEWLTRSRLYSDADGNIRLSNQAADDFGLLQFGGTTNAYPALKRNSTDIVIRLADDSANANIQANRFIVSPTGDFRWSAGSAIASLSDGNIRLTDNAGTDFSLLQFGGTTSSFPALKRNGVNLEAKLADDSTYTYLYCSGLVATSANITLWSNGGFTWSAKSRMYSNTDGNIRLTNNAQDDFGLLQFGGTTSSYPALKRNGAGLDLRLADDSAYAALTATALTSTNQIFAGSSSFIGFTTKSRIYSPSDGVVDFTDSAGTSPAAIHASRDVEANTATVASPNALTVLESNKVFSNEAATEKNGQALPPAVAGIQYTFVVQDSDGIRVIAQTGDTIRHAASVSSSGGYIESTTVGDVLTVVAINSTEWFVINTIGSGWTTG